jgi:hypothetical protein
MSRGVEKEFELLAEYFCLWKRFVVRIFAGVVEFREISDGGMTRARRLEFTFAGKKIFQQASSPIYIISSTCESRN